MRVILLVILAAALVAGQRKPALRAHPDIGGASGECLECHRGICAARSVLWEAGPEGSRLDPRPGVARRTA